MVLYRLENDQYQPVLAPLHTGWVELKKGLESLPLSVAVPSEEDDDLLSPSPPK
jgi:hypothetical protein